MHHQTNIIANPVACLLQWLFATLERGFLLFCWVNTRKLTEILGILKEAAVYLKAAGRHQALNNNNKKKDVATNLKESYLTFTAPAESLISGQELRSWAEQAQSLGLPLMESEPAWSVKELPLALLSHL